VQRTSLLLLVTIVVAGLWQAAPTDVAQAYPEPEIVSPAWELQFTHDDPRPIAVRNLEGKTRWYWYMTYKVVNKTGEERLFVPEITIATDQGDIMVAGRGVPAAVFQAIKEKVENPLLESPVAVVGRILLGEDHAKESAAIWPAADHDVDHIRVFFGGLSGETEVIEDPLTGDTIVTRKTLMMEYGLPGTPATPDQQPVISGPERWVMR
jgi:hypothetical protein